MEVRKVNCPHCKQKIISSPTLWRTALDSPLRNCPHCNGNYLLPATFEWSIIGPFGKFFYCFLGNVRCVCVGVLLNYEKNHHPINFFTWILAYLAACLILLVIFDHKKIKDSYRRSKNNPEYIQKLTNLGYMSFDYIFDSYF